MKKTRKSYILLKLLLNNYITINLKHLFHNKFIIDIIQLNNFMQNNFIL